VDGCTAGESTSIDEIVLGTGTYTLTLTVTDHAGQTNASTTTVIILDNEDPTPSIAAPETVGEENASLGCWSVDLDAGGSTDDFGIWRYEWDFGDGSTGAGQTITHSYCAAGTYDRLTGSKSHGRKLELTI